MKYFSKYCCLLDFGYIFFYIWSLSGFQLRLFGYSGIFIFLFYLASFILSIRHNLPRLSEHVNFMKLT